MKKLFLLVLVFVTYISCNKTEEDYNKSGLAKSDLKDYKGAIADYNKAIEINPDFSEAYENRAKAKDKLKDYEGAIVDYSEVIILSPNNSYAYYFRGGVKSSLDDYRGAIADFTKAIEIDSKFGEAYYIRGLIKQRYLNDKDSACLDFSKAGELGESEAYEIIKTYCN